MPKEFCHILISATSKAEVDGISDALIKYPKSKSCIAMIAR